MFTWLDLIAPIGVCLGSAALCLWAAIKGKAKDRKVAVAISIATGVLFLAGIPAWYIVRGQMLKPDYTTSYGLDVVQGKLNKCEEPWVNEHTKWLIDFWSKHYDPAKVNESVKGKLLVCLDEEKLTVWGRFVRGYSQGKFSVIGWNGKLTYSESLLKHELSHQIVMPFVPYSEEGHHQLFKEKKLGY